MMIRFRTITDPFHAMFSIALFLLLFFTPSSLASSEASSQTQTGTATEIPVLTIKGAIGPAISDYLTTEMAIANQAGAPLVVIIIDTPGGLVSSLRDINQAILNSQVPIACLVHPAGARAASGDNAFDQFPIAALVILQPWHRQRP